MKLIFKILLLFIIVQCYSCNCGTIECRSYGIDYDKYVPNAGIKNFEYINGQGDTIKFIQFESHKYVGGNKKCPGSPLGGGCTPCDCQEPSSSVNYYAKDSFRSTVITGNTTSASYYCLNKSQFTDSFFLSYTIIDATNTVKVNASNFIANSSDSILPTFSIGGKNYNNVLLHYNDTTTVAITPTYTQHKYVWKTYYVNEKGIIAFFDRLTNSLFYLN